MFRWYGKKNRVRDCVKFVNVKNEPALAHPAPLLVLHTVDLNVLYFSSFISLSLSVYVRRVFFLFIHYLFQLAMQNESI